MRGKLLAPGNGSKAPQERFILLGTVILETWRVFGKDVTFPVVARRATVDCNVLYLIVTMIMSDGYQSRRLRESVKCDAVLEFLVDMKVPPKLAPNPKVRFAMLLRTSTGTCRIFFPIIESKMKTMIEYQDPDGSSY